MTNRRYARFLVTACWVGLGAVVIAPAVNGQTGSSGGRDSLADTTSSQPDNTLVPLPVLFYQPETGLGLGGLASYYFRLGSAERRTDTRPSSVALVGIYTTKKQVIAAIESELYPLGARYWLVGTAGYSRFPTKFWGIGNDAPEAAEEDYTPEVFDLLFDLQRRVVPQLYIGPTGRVAYRHLAKVTPDGLLDSGGVPGTDDGRIIGFGGVLTWDTRSSNVYPRGGGFHQLRGTVYDGLFGSSYDYASFTVDLRRYVQPVASHVLALRGLGTATTGSPPFDILPQLGGEELLRGYFQGRFRDRHLLALEAEYRAPLAGRLGVVAFGGAGQVADALGAFAAGRFKTTLGAGLRFLISPQEGLNLRADLAYGVDVKSGGFYLSIGEAF